jgi:hypothetical protein
MDHCLPRAGLSVDRRANVFRNLALVHLIGGIMLFGYTMEYITHLRKYLEVFGLDFLQDVD